MKKINLTVFFMLSFTYFSLDAAAQESTPKTSLIELKFFPKMPEQAGKQPAKEKFVHLFILPTSTPATRTRLSFNNVKTGEHAEVEWSPLEDSRAGRTLFLPAGEWYVSSWSEPTRYANNPSVNYAWPTVGLGTIDTEKVEPVGAEFPKNTDQNNITIYVGKLPVPGLEQALGGWIKADGGATGGPPLLGPYRSFSGDISNTTKDIILILGEIITERVTARGIQVLKRRVKEKLRCDENIGEQGTIIEHLHFVETCGFIESVRFETLGTQGDILVRAITNDIINWLKKSIFKQLESQEVAGPIKLLIESLHDQNTSGGASYEKTLRFLSVLSFQLIDKNPHPLTFEKHLTAALVVAAQCRSHANCDVRTITYLVKNIKEIFGDSYESKEELIKIAHKLVLASARTSEISDVERALMINEAIFDALTLADTGNQFKYVTGTKTIAEGIIRRDLNYMVRGILLILEEEAKKENRDDVLAAMRTLSAIAAFLDLDTSGSVADQAARRSAKKRSLELLIDSVVSREDRSYEWVFGLHGALAWNIYLRNEGIEKERTDEEKERADEDSAEPNGSISLPLGASASYYYSSENLIIKGFQIDIDFLDIGAYAKFINQQNTELEWADIFVPALSLKSLLFDNELPLSVGVRLATNRDFNQVNIMINIGFDVPLFDLY